jgi:hypothetical protein
MKQIILVILLKNNPCGFLSVMMTEDQAREICYNWLSGAYKLKGTTRIGDSHSAHGSWAINIDDILGMHTSEPPTGTQPAPKGFSQGPIGWNPTPKGSG